MLDLGLRVQEFEYQDAAMEYYNEHERLRPYAPRDEYVSCHDSTFDDASSRNSITLLGEGWFNSTFGNMI